MIFWLDVLVHIIIFGVVVGVPLLFFESQLRKVYRYFENRRQHRKTMLYFNYLKEHNREERP